MKTKCHQDVWQSLWTCFIQICQEPSFTTQKFEKHKHLWWINNVSCQYKVHFRLWPMSKKSWAKLPKESMTNRTYGGAKHNGIFNCHKTFRCVDLVCVIELVYTMDLVCQVMVERAWMININKCRKVVICSKTFVCLELVCMICDKFVACNRTSVCGEINACGDGRQSSNDGMLGVGWWNNGIAMLEVTTIKVKWWCQQPSITLKVKKTQSPIPIFVFHPYMLTIEFKFQVINLNV
jgi:hypothetical protein